MHKLVDVPRKETGSGVVRIARRLDERLTQLAGATGRSKAYYANKAIEAYLDNAEDYLTAVAALEASGERIPLRDLKKRLKLDD